MRLSNAALTVAQEQPPLADRRARPAIALCRRPSESRSRIIETAERLVRQFGHQKTTVADIARTLSMSSANIYRFFRSKDAINEAVCRRLLGDVIAVAAEFAQRNGTAKDNLRALLIELARINAERYRKDKALHQLLALAASENWPAVTDYVERMESIVAAIIADGTRRGEFCNRDARRAGRCVHTAMLRHLHPNLVSECDGAGQPSLGEMVDFCLAALR